MAEEIKTGWALDIQQAVARLRRVRDEAAQLEARLDRLEKVRMAQIRQRLAGLEADANARRQSLFMPKTSKFENFGYLASRMAWTSNFGTFAALVSNRLFTEVFPANQPIQLAFQQGIMMAALGGPMSGLYGVTMGLFQGVISSALQNDQRVARIENLLAELHRNAQREAQQREAFERRVQEDIQRFREQLEQRLEQVDESQRRATLRAVAARLVYSP